MTGWWSKIPDSGSGSVLESLKTLRKGQTKELLLNLKLSSKGEVNSDETDNFRVLFNHIVSYFLSDICGSRWVRPLPPLLGNGQAVDLLKLYSVVREKGGYENVSRNGLWKVIAKEIGFDSSLSTSLKLVYVKYLDMLDTWFGKLVKEKGLTSMELESDIDDARSIISDVKKENGKCVEVEMELDGDKEKLYRNDEIQSFEGSNGGKDSASVKDDNNGFESKNVQKEDETSRKRKRECHLALINWVRSVAKDPCDPVIGSLPERYKWKAYGNENIWKQVLLAREAMLLKRPADTKAMQSVWQVKQKMHPTMYDDQSASERARCSRRIISAKESQAVLSHRKSQARAGSESSSSGPQSDMGDQSDNLNQDSLLVNNIKRKKIPLGPYFQAKVPEWTGEKCQSDDKWLGMRVWPLEKIEHNRNLIERDRIGKGRQELCGCQFIGSQECVRFHIAEKRNKVRLELGSAFKQWKLDKIGEEVALSWTPQEEKTFEDIVKNNPASLEKCFWDEIQKHFRSKSREILVSYYFNVYLLHRRAHQNRTTPRNIDSDDDELEKYGTDHEVSKSPGSILCSPKKVHLNAR